MKWCKRVYHEIVLDLINMSNFVAVAQMSELPQGMTQYYQNPSNSTIPIWGNRNLEYSDMDRTLKWCQRNLKARGDSNNSC